MGLEGGLGYRWPAAREGGAQNGVLTAVEDFVAAHDGLELAVVPAFFGLGVVWRRDAAWADEVAELLAPWHQNPMLARLEANRVHHLATEQILVVQKVVRRDRMIRKDETLRRLLDSRTFALAERISRLRQRGRPAFSREDVRRTLAAGE